MRQIQISKKRRKGTPETSGLREKIGLILDYVGLDDVELSLLFTTDKHMRALNLEYRGIDSPTDVLSFSQLEGDDSGLNPEMLGDLVISVDTAKRYADEAGRSLPDEIDALMVHGILHLLGYDHETGPDDSRRMKAKERAILRRLAAVG